MVGLNFRWYILKNVIYFLNISYSLGWIVQYCQTQNSIMHTVTENEDTNSEKGICT